MYSKFLKLLSLIIIVLILLDTFRMHSYAADKVTICHATASDSNPYNKQSVDISSLGDGHGTNGINAGDIVPPTPGTDFPNGNNWDTTGQAIYNNDCNVPGPSATPTPSVSVTPTPSVSP